MPVGKIDPAVAALDCEPVALKLQRNSMYGRRSSPWKSRSSSCLLGDVDRTVLIDAQPIIFDLPLLGREDSSRQETDCLCVGKGRGAPWLLSELQGHLPGWASRAGSCLPDARLGRYEAAPSLQSSCRRAAPRRLRPAPCPNVGLMLDERLRGQPAVASFRCGLNSPSFQETSPSTRLHLPCRRTSPLARIRQSINAHRSPPMTPCRRAPVGREPQRSLALERPTLHFGVPSAGCILPSPFIESLHRPLRPEGPPMRAARGPSGNRPAEMRRWRAVFDS